MWFEQVLFFLAAIGALGGALGVVLLRNPFYSVLALVAHLLALAVLFLLLHAEFLAAAQVVVYAGAVMVLYVFVVAYIGGADEPLRPRAARVGAFGPLFAARSASSCASRSSAAGSRRSTPRAPTSAPASARPAQIGELLLTRSSWSRSRPPRSCCWWPPWAPSCSRAAPARARGGGGHGPRPPAAPARWTPSRSGSDLVPRPVGVHLLRSAPPACSRAATRSVVLLCLELMLNAGNLALVAFSRMHGNGDGQVFALIVMVIAACEVVIGLGIIVAMYRNRLPIDVDEMSELRG